MPALSRSPRGDPSGCWRWIPSPIRTRCRLPGRPRVYLRPQPDAGSEAGGGRARLRSPGFSAGEGKGSGDRTAVGGLPGRPTGGNGPGGRPGRPWTGLPVASSPGPGRPAPARRPDPRGSGQPLPHTGIPLSAGGDGEDPRAGAAAQEPDRLLPAEGRILAAGHPRWYRQRFALGDPTTWPKPEVAETRTVTNRRGRIRVYPLQAWREIRRRGTREWPMGGVLSPSSGSGSPHRRGRGSIPGRSGGPSSPPGGTSGHFGPW